MKKNTLFLQLESYKFSRRRAKFFDAATVLFILLLVLGCGRVSTSRSSSNSRADRRRNNITNRASDDKTITGSTDDWQQLANTLATISLQYSRAGNLGDKATLRRILADDFSAEVEGKTYDKEKFIEEVGSAGTLVSVKSDNPRIIEQQGAFATLEYKIIVEFKDRTETAVCTDEFVNRAGKWQITSNQCRNQ